MIKHPEEAIDLMEQATYLFKPDLGERNPWQNQVTNTVCVARQEVKNCGTQKSIGCGAERSNQQYHAPFVLKQN